VDLDPESENIIDYYLKSLFCFTILLVLEVRSIKVFYIKMSGLRAKAKLPG
jgi:hypothetical protein